MRTSIVELQTRRMRRSAQLWGGGCCGGWTEAVPRGAGQCKDLVVHTALCCKYKYDSNWERAVKRKFEFENIQFWGAEAINLPTHLQNRRLASNYSTMTGRCSQIAYEYSYEDVLALSLLAHLRPSFRAFALSRSEYYEMIGH